MCEQYNERSQEMQRIYESYISCNEYTLNKKFEELRKMIAFKSFRYSGLEANMYDLLIYNKKRLIKK